MNKPFHTPFKLSVICLAIFSVQSSFALEDVQLKTIKLQAMNDQSDLNSEASKKYIINKSKSASKLNLSIKETPQTVNTVTQQQIKDFNLTNSRDILASAPGVNVASQETNRTTYRARGFDISNFQIDGSNMPLTGSDYQNGDVDALLYDRIDVVKGANGLTSSTGNPSATVNYIRKRPTAEFQANGALSYGSWDNVRAEADVSGSLDENQQVRARVMAAQEAGNSYLDNYEKEKTIAGVILEADLTDKTLLTLGYNYQKDRPNGNNWGALPMLDKDGQMLSYPRSYNPMPDWVHWDVERQNTFVELKHNFNDDWSLQTSYNYNQHKENGALLYFTGVPDADGKGVSEYPSLFEETNKNHNIDLSLQGKYPLFGQTHELMLGANWTQNKVSQQSFYVAGKSTPIDNWNDYQNSSYPDFIFDYDTPANKANYTQEQKRAYAATRLHFGEKLKVLLGGNYTKATSKGQNYGNSTDFDNSKFLPYAGITYEFNPTYTAYASYSTIYKPTALLGLDKKTLDPMDGKSYEIGVKGSWFDDQLIVSSAIFRNEFNKFPIYAKWDQASLYDQQDIKSIGYEFNIAGQVTDHLNISAGYVQQNMKDKATNQDTRTFVPERTFNIMTAYSIPQIPQLKVGANLSWQDKTTQTSNSNLKQDSYALLDLMASYDINNNVSIQANVKNVTNEKYLNTLEYGQAYYGAPTNYNLAVRFKY